MLTVKVVTQWVGSQTPDFSGYIKPSEHIFECRSIYDDAGNIRCDGCEFEGVVSGSITYDSVQYDQPWETMLYVMNRNGATVGKYMIGSFGGDIGCHSRIAPNPWHKPPIELAQPLTPGEQLSVAPGATAA